MKPVAQLGKRFEAMYGQPPRIYSAPGRVNLIGEHTDYNDGLVMPAAIGFRTWVALGPRQDRRVEVYSENFSESAEFDLDARPERPRRHWSDYVFGVAAMLEAAGHRLRGAEMLVLGEVPMGAGLSSSAALEVAAGYALLANSGLPIDRVELARLCRQAENDYVDMRCGIMDQFVSCCGRAGHALLLDCRSLEYRLLRLAADVSLVICNTGVRRELASVEYNKRRLECEAGARLLSDHLPQVRSLRDVTREHLERYGGDLPKAVYRRCRHVVGENARVLAAAAALERNDMASFGTLMGESHRSLRDDFEVSCAELDLLVDLAASAPGVFGARMTGGGFGGCTINLVRSAAVNGFKDALARGYEQKTGRVPEIYVSAAAEGVA